MTEIELNRVRIPSESAEEVLAFLGSHGVSWIQKKEIDPKAQQKAFNEYTEKFAQRVRTLKDPKEPGVEERIAFGYRYLASDISGRHNLGILDDEGVITFRDILVDQIFLECTRESPTYQVRQGDDLGLTRWQWPILNPRQIITLVVRYGLEKGMDHRPTPYKIVSEEFGAISSQPSRQAILEAFQSIWHPENRAKLEPTNIFVGWSRR